MAQPKIHVETKEAWAAVFFVILILGIMAAINVGVLKNPVTVGLIVTMTTVLLLIGHFLVTKNIISKGILPLWYMLIFGIMLMLAGGILSGAVAPAFVVSGATVLEIAITNALFYTLVIAAVLSAVVLYVVYYRKGKLI